MKKKNVINLIKYYAEKNDVAFRNEAYEIAHDFDSTGDYQLAEYIMATLANVNTFTPQMTEESFQFFTKLERTTSKLPLPEAIEQDVEGIINAINHNMGINKYLFQGAPGTGKTETVKQIGRLLNREIYRVNFDEIIDSKLGQTSKNITSLFDDINNLAQPEKVIILFDEIDSLALDRTNSNDVREMGRATSSVLKEFDTLNPNIVLIATTNLFTNFDKALSRRFDYIVDFNRYNQEDLLEISEILLDYYLNQFKNAKKDIKIFRKILALLPNLPYPGDLKNLIRSSLAFSSISNKTDYLRILYLNVTGEKEIPKNFEKLQKQKFTIREIETLTGISKSSIAREIKQEKLA